MTSVAAEAGGSLDARWDARELAAEWARLFEQGMLDESKRTIDGLRRCVDCGNDKLALQLARCNMHAKSDGSRVLPAILTTTMAFQSAKQVNWKLEPTQQPVGQSARVRLCLPLDTRKVSRTAGPRRVVRLYPDWRRLAAGARPFRRRPRPKPQAGQQARNCSRHVSALLMPPRKLQPSSAGLGR